MAVVDGVRIIRIHMKTFGEFERDPRSHCPSGSDRFDRVDLSVVLGHMLTSFLAHVVAVVVLLRTTLSHKLYVFL